MEEQESEARINRRLEQSFPGATVELETPYDDRVGGVLLWDGFQGVDQIDRQRRLWKALRSGLTQGEQLRVTAILTVTPSERSAIARG